ncbi:hypothetical protein COY33_02450 [candidate division WWE3 bacterium CG_4_10_14_0_2_um_filter_42_7]|uniref:DUF4446 domain-containing protein n=1 Tax=candidate division WWE3 bacterium CG_4_10_14_0_2_um_filter_42_7 TaxID=1975073 RepID=A0A2M7TC98_UNCKA|nr:MAG: hypothetical protein COY33_02450 [candidate division WWE3 bacterium CG_4_10_14_0_2_um_filter_42_7]
MIISTLLLVIIIVLNVSWLGVLSFLLYRYINFFRYLTKGYSSKDLKEVLEKRFEHLENAEKDIKLIKEDVLEIKNDNLNHLQKYSLVRFNPFSDTGGNQSFAVSLLDKKGSGVVISSLFTREGTRIYSKPVKEGKDNGFPFSEEESRAVKEAIS